MDNKTGAKGFTAEEALRGYFRSIGYFVVRGIPLIYKEYDVTDVDLWLYVKATSLAAERTCVDVKNKRTPQAMERVLWTKGLKEVLHLDRAIVVTSDNRSETRNFGAENGIGILQGEFLQRVVTNFRSSDRLTEEEFFFLLKTPCVIDSSIDWCRWFKGIKAKLLDKLNFDGCNSLLLAIKLLINEYLATSNSSKVSVRLLYICLAYFLINLDYTSRSFVQLDTTARSNILINGFRYGEAGRQRTEEIMQMAFQLLSETGKTDLFTDTTLHEEFERQLSEYRSEILGEYFAKSESLKSLFSIACSFEEQAYSKKLLLPNELISEQKAIIGLICDLNGYDRKKII